jgi:lambda family phage portal protein
VIGKRVGYWMFPFHPGDPISTQSILGNVARRVRSDVVLHCFHQRQAGQVRGIPGIAAVLALLKDLEDTFDAVVLRTKLQNLFVTFEETPDDDSILDAPDEAGGDDDLLDGDDVPIRALEPGTHVIGPPGHKFVHSTPPQDAGNLEDFLRASLRGVAMGAGMTYEMLTGDLRQTSFSSIRAGLVEYRRMMEARMQRHLVFQFCKPTYRVFLETAILSGRISLSDEELRKAMHPTWYGTPGWEYVDPDKEVKADVRAVRAGFTSRKAIVAKGGRRIERVDEELKEERADKDLVLDTDPAAIAELEERGEESGVAGEA